MRTCSALTVVQDTWIMFNDFVVREVSEEEVFSFPDTWKVRHFLLVKLTTRLQQLSYSKEQTAKRH
jgi:hypothetical protein